MIKEDISGPKAAFVLSPIGKSGSAERRAADLALHYIIEKAFAPPEWEVVRADMESAPDSITHQVIKRIVDAELVVADLTDHNPNVFYELAVAHAYGKPVIHMCQEGQTVPFDIVDQRVTFYELTDPRSVADAISALQASQVWLFDHPDEQRTPLSTFRTLDTISSNSGGDGSEVADALAQILDRLSSVEQRLPRSGGIRISAGDDRVAGVGTKSSQMLTSSSLEEFGRLRRLITTRDRYVSKLRDTEALEQTDETREVIDRLQKRLVVLGDEISAMWNEIKGND